MEICELKKIFAKALLKDKTNPFNAACKAFPDDTGEACKKAVEWQNDSEVLDYIEYLKTNNEEMQDLKANKNEAANLAWELANNQWLKGIERVKALELYATIVGYMPYKTTNKNIKLEGNVSGVMVVKDKGTESDWESKLIEQQKALINAN